MYLLLALLILLTVPSLAMRQQQINSNDMQCAKECTEHVTKNVAVMFGIFNTETTTTDFNDTGVPDFDVFCHEFDAMDMCVSECGMTAKRFRNFMDIFEPIGYVCHERRAAFIQWSTCYSNVMTNITYRNQCYEQCGDRKYMTSMFENFEMLRRNFRIDDMDEMVKLADDMCSYGDCMATCREPQFVDTCSTVEPLVMLRDFANRIINVIFDKFEMFKLGTEMPTKCREIAEWNTSFVPNVDSFAMTTTNEPVVEHCSVDFTFTVSKCGEYDGEPGSFDWFVVYYFDKFNKECMEMRIPVWCNETFADMNMVNWFENFERCWYNCKPLIMETDKVKTVDTQFSDDELSMKEIKPEDNLITNIPVATETMKPEDAPTTTEFLTISTTAKETMIDPLTETIDSALTDKKLLNCTTMATKEDELTEGSGEEVDAAKIEKLLKTVEIEPDEIENMELEENSENEKVDLLMTTEITKEATTMVEIEEDNEKKMMEEKEDEEEKEKEDETDDEDNDDSDDEEEHPSKNLIDDDEQTEITSFDEDSVPAVYFETRQRRVRSGSDLTDNIQWYDKEPTPQSTIVKNDPTSSKRLLRYRRNVESVGRWIDEKAAIIANWLKERAQDAKNAFDGSSDYQYHYVYKRGIFDGDAIDDDYYGDDYEAVEIKRK